MKKISIFCLILFFSANTFAEDCTPKIFDLIDIYTIAIDNDPTLQAAKETQLAAIEALPQASAQFLPVILAQTTHTVNDYQGDSFFTLGIRGGTVGSYRNNVYALNLTQPILHFEHWEKYVQACDLVKQANATFASAEQDLMIRTATAYFAVLQAIENLMFATAQVNALQKFYEQTNERFKVGLIAITDVQIAKARHDSAVATEISAKTAIQNQYEKLDEIVGYRIPYLAPLKIDIKLPTPEPRDIETWVCTAINQNFDLLAARYKTWAAHADIKLNQFNHLPTLDLVGSLVRTTPSNQIQFKNTLGTLGFQMNLPLFSGGAVFSKTRQAKHQFLKTDRETETLFRTTESNTRQFYRNVLNQIAQVEALKQAVVSNQSALEATQASFNVGTRTIVDVLNAQTDLIQAQQNLAVARYTYVTQSLQLKRVAGLLSPEDLANINCWLNTPPDKLRCCPERSCPPDYVKALKEFNAKTNCYSSGCPTRAIPPASCPPSR